MVNYADLTDRQAVDDALAEFDRVGRDAFLHSYGFGEAKDYFLVTEKGRYDSKAIFAVAYRNERGVPLESTDFSGGKTGAAQRLKELGYVIEGLESPSRRRYFESFDDALTEFPLVMENRSAVREFLADRDYEKFYIPEGGSYIAAVPRGRRTADFFHHGYIWFRDAENNGHMHWLPVNKGHAGGYSRRRPEREASTCPNCGSVMPLSGVCDFC